MSHSLRYRQAAICEHLASQYVAGVMTPRVRKRMQALLEITPELDRAVAFWSDRFAQLHYHMPTSDMSAPARLNTVWQSIEAGIDTSPAPQPTLHWWHTVLFWRLTSAAGALASLVLAIVLLSPVAQQLSAPTNTVVNAAVGPSYLAAMSASQGGDDSIHFVISAYPKNAGKPSSLQVQWSKNHAINSGQSLHLWAEDKTSGQLSYIGTEPSTGEPWHLVKASWQAIANSSRLIMTTNPQLPSSENTAFSGPCVQLKPWAVSAT